MSKRLPPMQFLACFEAAGRLLSFKAAAAELHVSPSAVSQQIKSLEDYMSGPLFSRAPGGVDLTPLGIEFHELASELLQRYRQGFIRINSPSSAPLRLSTMTHLAYDLLIPNLPGFRQANPEIDLRIETGDSLVDFHQDQVSAAIRIGDGNWPDLHCHKLCDVRATCLVSPNLYAQLDVDSPKVLFDLPLIHSRLHANDWEELGKGLNMDFSANEQLYFDDYFSAMAATAQGLGVMIGLMPLAGPQIQQGKLQKLLNVEIPVSRACYLITPPEQVNNPSLARVQKWLKDIFLGLDVN